MAARSLDTHRPKANRILETEDGLQTHGKMDDTPALYYLKTINSCLMKRMAVTETSIHSQAPGLHRSLWPPGKRFCPSLKTWYDDIKPLAWAGRQVACPGDLSDGLVWRWRRRTQCWVRCGGLYVPPSAPVTSVWRYPPLQRSRPPLAHFHL